MSLTLLKTCRSWIVGCVVVLILNLRRAVLILAGMSRGRVAFACGLAAVCIGAALSGCSWKGGDEGSGFAPLKSLMVWKIEPVRIRIYPSTRFVQDGHQHVLEARVELIDEMGDPLKSVGQFRLELFARGKANSPGLGQRLYVWDVSALTLAEQRLYYDSITRAYLFRLKIDDENTAKRDTLLHISYQSLDGKRLETQSSLPIDFRTTEAASPQR